MYIEQRQITDPSRWVDVSHISIVEAAIADVGPKPLKPIKELVGEEIDYDTIRIVAGCWQNRHAAVDAPSESSDEDDESNVALQ